MNYKSKINRKKYFLFKFWTISTANHHILSLVNIFDLENELDSEMQEKQSEKSLEYATGKAKHVRALDEKWLISNAKFVLSLLFMTEQIRNVTRRISIQMHQILVDARKSSSSFISTATHAGSYKNINKKLKHTIVLLISSDPYSTLQSAG